MARFGGIARDGNTSPMMPRLAVDFRSEENRVGLYYAAAASLFGALASRLVATLSLPAERLQ